MRQISGFLMAVYSFFVGDPIILSGVAITLVVVGVLGHADALAGMRSILGVLLIAGVLASLALSLARETRPKQR